MILGVMGVKVILSHVLLVFLFKYFTWSSKSCLFLHFFHCWKHVIALDVIFGLYTKWNNRENRLNSIFQVIHKKRNLMLWVERYIGKNKCHIETKMQFRFAFDRSREINSSRASVQPSLFNFPGRKSSLTEILTDGIISLKSKKTRIWISKKFDTSRISMT
jgi:hypothetical protein